VQEKDDGPLLFGGPILGQEDLISVGLAVEGNRAVEKAGFWGLGGGSRCERQSDGQDRKAKQQMKAQ
jgi:hypothetical protein